MKTKLTEADEAAIAAILMEQLEVARDQITPDARLRDDLGADSLDIAEITMKLEDRFGVELEDQEADDTVTVARIHTALEQCLSR